MSHAEASAPEHSLRAAWARFWFAPGEAVDLGLCRLVFLACLLYALPIPRFGAWATLPAAMWEPIALFRWLGLMPASAAALDTMSLALEVALVTAALGFLTRSSCTVAALLSFYLFGLSQCFGGVYHGTTVVPPVLLILALARSGDTCSLDSLLRRASGRAPASSAAAAGEYTWPIRLAQCLCVLVFCAAGVAKLRHGGLAWAFSDNLREILIGQHYNVFAPTSDLGLRVAEHRYLCMATAAVLMTAEALAPLALFSVAARRVLLPLLVVFLLALPPLFGFRFQTFLALFVFWIPWQRLGRRLGVAGYRDRPFGGAG
jgi:hypothetical protein